MSQLYNCLKKHSVETGTVTDGPSLAEEAFYAGAAAAINLSDRGMELKCGLEILGFIKSKGLGL